MITEKYARESILSQVKAAFLLDLGRSVRLHSLLTAFS
jgi:hypothetical protein